MHDLIEEIDVSERCTECTDENAGSRTDTDALAPKASLQARVLTVPGAVYRINTSTVIREAPEATYAAVPPAADVPTMTDEGAEICTETVAEEALDESYLQPITAPCEPRHEMTQPAVTDAAEADIESDDADCGLLQCADSFGEYTATVGHAEPEPISAEPHPIGIPYDPSHEEEEYERFLASQEKKREITRKKSRVSEDDGTGQVHLPIDAIDKSVKLVETRMLYEIEALRSEHRVLGYTFSSDVLKKERTERELCRQINDRMYKLSRALKYERKDSTRYYTAALDKYAGNAGKREKNTLLIESILGRLDYLLKEREKIDDRLMSLYGGVSDKPTGARKEIKIAERTARAAYKAQLKTARRVARMHAPEELKEKIYALMNERIKLLSTIEKNEYLLSKKRYTGPDKRVVKRQNKEMRRAVRRGDDDIRFFIKKAQKHDTAHSDGIRQIGWLIATLLLVGAVAGFYLLGKYYWGWF